LSNEEVGTGLERAVADVRRSTGELIAYLGEGEERRLHLLAGCGSMFEFCVERLGFSEDEACRRIEVARLARRFPVMFPLLAEGTLSLSAAALLEPLDAGNVEELLAGVSGKSVRKAKEFLAACFPGEDVPSTVRKLPERAASSTIVESARAESAAQPEMKAANLAGVSNTSCSDAPHRMARSSEPSEKARADVLEPLSSERYAIRFTASKELKDKLELARDLLRHASPSSGGSPWEQPAKSAKRTGLKQSEVR